MYAHTCKCNAPLLECTAYCYTQVILHIIKLNYAYKYCKADAQLEYATVPIVQAKKNRYSTTVGPNHIPHYYRTVSMCVCVCVRVCACVCVCVCVCVLR